MAPEKPEPQVIYNVHKNEGGKYRFVIERAATKGILGYKIEANSDSIVDGLQDIKTQHEEIQMIAGFDAGPGEATK